MATTDVGFAFDAGVARCLKGNTPRRVMKIETPLEALDSWSRLVGELDEALNMFTYERFYEVRLAMEHLSQRSPNIFTCSFLQVHFYQDDCTLGRHLGKADRGGDLRGSMKAFIRSLHRGSLVSLTL